MLRAMELPETKERFNALAVEAIGSSPEEFVAMLTEEVAKWGPVVKAAGITVQ
jgi:tripartite-type tricarboxylate transporter receptor subunit TctC